YLNLYILALDGWTSLTGKSLWNFVIYLDDGKDILWKIQDYSNASGGLKTYIDTRWTTVYEMLKSVYQLEICLKESIKAIIYTKKGFFNDVYNLAKIFKPIKDAIIKLENRNATLADCYFALIDDDEGTIWENLNLLEIIDLENNIFKDDDDEQFMEISDNENELDNFIQDLESEKDYNPSELAQKYFEDIDDIYYY
ncbi:8810_t:CDS:2, partial [Racocetra fulgida]